MKESDRLIQELQNLLVSGSVSSQEAIIQHLETLGFQVNQSKVSRLLRKVGAAKTTASDGSVVYLLPKEPPPTTSANISDLVQHIRANESLISIQTTPGAANLVARLIDHNTESLGVLGSIAGDDHIFVAPKSIANIATTLKAVEQLLYAQ